MSKTPEGKVKDQIRKYMRASGWTMIHIPGNTFSFPGSPDYIALRKGTCVFIEVKSAKGKLTEAQEQAKCRPRWIRLISVFVPISRATTVFFKAAARVASSMAT